jgi:XapX domain-containing protein
MIAASIGFLLSFLLGSACRYFDIPLPAPPSLGGAVLILALTGGYVVGQWLPAIHF